MWGKLKALKFNQVGKELREVSQSLNVNEEYLGALRTESFADFFSKVRSLLNQHTSSPSYNFHGKCSEIFLEPGQEAISTILNSPLYLSKTPELKSLLLNYFDISAEASSICSHLLKTINQIQSNHLFIQKAFDHIDQDYSPANVELIVSKLNMFVVENNPFSDPNKHDFKLIHDRYASVLECLKSMKRKVARKIKLVKCFQRASGICITAACGVVTITAIVLAAHTLTAIFMGPAIFSFPIKRFLKKIYTFPFWRSGILKKVGDQIDLAAKGTYILNRDFDMMSRLVTRLHDAVEHNKAMIRSCLERRKYLFCLQVVKELRKNENAFKKQVEELEEHLYLSLVTINRARALVFKEMIKTTTTCVKKINK
ncbi:hypothetical protein UlMin_036383 [Ulmus minor]